MGNHQEGFHDFDIQDVACFTATRLVRLLNDTGIIRNKGKIKAIIQNAQNFVVIQKRYGSFQKYLDSQDKSNNYANVVKDLINKFKWLGSIYCKHFPLYSGRKHQRLGAQIKEGSSKNMGMAKSRAHVYVSGKVQGVFFRQNTKRQAQSQGVKGWVKNLEDGRVEAIFEGEEEAVKAVVEFCKKGPKGASVTDITVDWEPFKEEFQNFTIAY